MKNIKTNFKIYLAFNLIICLLLLTSCKETPKKTVNTTTNTEASSNTTFTSKMTKSDKKKYYQNGNVVYEVKYKDDGFKLRTASSSLLWKVKLYDDKIKISNNEENLNPYEIKVQETHKAKLVKDDATIARTSYDTSTQSQTITNSNNSDSQTVSQSYSPSLLVNMIAEIPKDQKQLLIEELVAKGY